MIFLAGPRSQMAEWRRRGTYFAVLKRTNADRDYFERAWKLQARCSAIFGPGVEDTFLLLQKARRQVEVSAAMLVDNPEPGLPTEDDKRLGESFTTMFGTQASMKGHFDKVGGMLSDFRKQLSGCAVR